MADRHPALGVAAYRNAQLLKECTSDGLLHGGPHYLSHGIKPCIHHTFAHAKAVALVLDKGAKVPKVDTSVKLPREQQYNVREFSDLAVWLSAKGPWRATISAYDFLYGKGKRSDLMQATGGALAVLHHEKVGPLFTSSMAEYIMIEEQNMQPQPGEDYPLTPRIETRKDGEWFTNLYDLEAQVTSSSSDATADFIVQTSLKNREKKPMKGDAPKFSIHYSFSQSETRITVKADENSSGYDVDLVLPLVSQTGEEVVSNEKELTVAKTGGKVIMTSTVALKVKKTEKGRIFNMVPGMEAIPISLRIPKGGEREVTCVLKVV